MLSCAGGRSGVSADFSSSNEEVRGKSWYFGPITRQECDVLMAEKGQDGDFLVRDSESNVSTWGREMIDIDR